MLACIVSVDLRAKVRRADLEADPNGLRLYS
jgi:hypothetical protein